MRQFSSESRARSSTVRVATYLPSESQNSTVRQSTCEGNAFANSMLQSQTKRITSPCGHGSRSSQIAESQDENATASKESAHRNALHLCRSNDDRFIFGYKPERDYLGLKESVALPVGRGAIYCAPYCRALQSLIKGIDLYSFSDLSRQNLIEFLRTTQSRTLTLTLK